MMRCLGCGAPSDNAKGREKRRPGQPSDRLMAAPYGRAVQPDSFYSSATALIASSYMVAKISSKLGALPN